ncbi:metallophosphoesterase [Porifericola rhodea]|uniref:metallophosphoesterase n=1 Tax=Porifericola rhodea TaxID=930972 RepID=UPI002664E6EF|nr:metallophosphoesterase [Porifericola rhodea]WKN32222.1 metallophosphoesterase [Porifericola rhodea]
MLVAEQKQTERKLWKNNRKKLEAIRFNSLSDYEKKKGYANRLDYVLPFLTWGLKVSGAYYFGKKNAQKVKVKHFELEFDRLPAAFDGYKILHLTDLHIDSLPGLEEVICQQLQGLNYDSCFITGDYRMKLMGEYNDEVLSPLRDIIACIQPEDGIYATLGNHDTYGIVEPLEAMGVRVLTNESVRLRKGSESILLTGLDDPHFYYTHHALSALDTKDDDFKIALVHSPELSYEAAERGYDFYLCGHTHAGQVCLPSGIPLITHLKKANEFYKGFWKAGEMQGYTSSGCGVSGIPVRFNTEGEICLFTLKRK